MSIIIIIIIIRYSLSSQNRKLYSLILRFCQLTKNIFKLFGLYIICDTIEPIYV